MLEKSRWEKLELSLFYYNKKKTKVSGGLGGKGSKRRAAEREPFS